MSTETIAVVGAAAGVLGALTGLVSLSWQIVVHRRSGRVVTVTATYSMPVYGPSNAPQFRDDDQITIVVRNRGGASVTVTNYGVALGGKKASNNLFVLDRLPWATQLPAAVEPGGEPVQVLVPVADLRRAHTEHHLAFKRMRPWVELGDGRRVYSNRGVPVSD